VRCRLGLMSTGGQNHGRPHRCCLNVHRRRSCPDSVAMGCQGRQRTSVAANSASGQAGTPPECGQPRPCSPADRQAVRGRVRRPLRADLRDTIWTRCGTKPRRGEEATDGHNEPPDTPDRGQRFQPEQNGMYELEFPAPSCRRLMGAARCWCTPWRAFPTPATRSVWPRATSETTMDTELVASFAIDDLLDYRSRRPLIDVQDRSLHRLRRSRAQPSTPCTTVSGRRSCCWPAWNQT